MINLKCHFIFSASRSNDSSFTLCDLLQISAKYIYEVADADAQIIFGVGVDETLGDSIRVTVIATGFENKSPIAAAPIGFGTGAAIKQQAPEIPDMTIKPIKLDDIALPPFMRRDK